LNRQILVTGATGFIGRPLCSALARAGLSVRALCRAPRQEFDSPGVAWQCCRDLATVEQWQPILGGIDTIIHLAGRAHVLHEHGNDAEDLYLRDNFTATLALARGAIECGVRRFVFLSSIKVYGDGPFSQPLAANQEPVPSEPYGRSKWRAELALLALAAESSMDIVIVRPPLVYGPGVRANFLRLLRWVERGVPLPLAAVHNQRSLIGLDNLMDFMVSLTLRSESTGGTWHVADREVISTAEMIRILATHMQRPFRLFPFPPALLRWGLTLAGRSLEYTRLCGSLVVDTQTTRDQLRWQPPHSLDDGLARTVAWFKNTRRDTES
jgi:nucleoside-diphosphate-sugar epimerase